MTGTTMGATTGESHLILHVGMPKAGSSALQTALSRTPDLTTASGQRLRYSALYQGGGRQSLLFGQQVVTAGRRSAYGYATWPNLWPGAVTETVFDNLRKVMEVGQQQGFAPIASCEGWISYPDLFAEHLARWGNPPVEVVAFLRPPVDWMNAAYWQWGVWNTSTLEAWMKRSNLPYAFGLDLERWAQIPNLRLRLGNARPDVVRKFAEFYECDLPSTASSNSSSPPALIGFLLRNREFRATGHAAATEFVIQRWCPPVTARKLWAVRPRHIRDLRETVEANREALRRIASAAQMQDILADARWTSEEPYLEDLRAGPSALSDRAELAALHAALLEGTRRACRTAEMAVPALPGCPSAAAPVTEWDAALRPLLEALLKADLAVRQAAGRSRSVWGRLRRGLPQVFARA
ncbi:hypothetical protein [Alloyangia pacifica]|uniref:hypothetical protein n=1 Tax=Alloyangia pacifica TaxID=311180 RepID=UPI001CFDB5CF|nr:hypothetical protein [Alloyangia pacifica]